VQFYGDTNLLGESTSAPYTFTWSNVAAGNYNFSVSALYDSGSTISSPSVPVIVTAVSLPGGQPPAGITFAADSGSITTPFVALNGVVFQNLYSGLTDGGRAAYSFTITNAGDYVVSAQV